MDTFIFYKSWLDAIDGFGEDFGEAYGWEMLYNLANYVCNGEFKTTKKSIMGWVLSCMPVIESAKERYEVCQENGKLGGRPKKVQDEEIQKLSESGVSKNEIAETVGCSMSSVQRALRNGGQNQVKTKSKPSQNHYVYVNDNANVNENVNANNNVKGEVYKEGGTGGETQVVSSVPSRDEVAVNVDRPTAKNSMQEGEIAVQGHEETRQPLKSQTQPTVKSKAQNFTPPTVDEIKAYCEERNNIVDAERFWNFYSSKGWMIGKNRMKDWKAAVRSWETSESERIAQSHTTAYNRTAKDMDDPMATYNIFAQLYDEEHGYTGKNWV